MNQKIDYAGATAGAMILPQEYFCDDCSSLIAPLPPDIQKAVEEHSARVHVPLHWCKCEAKKKEHLAWRRALLNLPTGDPLNFDNFKKVEGADAALWAAKAFADGKGKAILTLQGGTGRGKSHLAEAILRHCWDPERKLRYENVTDMLSLLRASYSDDGQNLNTQLLFYSSMEILVLDDLGVEKTTDWTVEKLNQIIDERIRNGKRTVITTNQSYEEMRDGPNFRLASRIFDIATGKVELVIMTAGDYRRGGGLRLG